MARSEQPNRRDALRTLAAGAIGAAAASSWVESLSAVAQTHAHSQRSRAAIAAANWKPQVLSASQNETVVALSELIIPQTDTAGAKTANVNRFIDSALNEAPSADREKFFQGLAWIDDRSSSLFGKPFVAADATQQISLLARVADPANKADDDRLGVEFFRAIKAMTISGYYATEVGLRRELGDDGHLVLERFVGCNHPEHQG